MENLDCSLVVGTRLSPLQRSRSVRARGHAASTAIRRNFFKHWQPLLTAAQLLQWRGTLYDARSQRLHGAQEGESTAKAWLAVKLIRANEPSECFQALSISSWRQQAANRDPRQAVQVKLRGRHKTQRVWQQLKPLIRNELLLLLSADRQTNGNSKTQKAIPEGERYRGIFFPPYCIHSLLTDIH